MFTDFCLCIPLPASPLGYFFWLAIMALAVNLFLCILIPGIRERQKGENEIKAFRFDEHKRKERDNE